MKPNRDASALAASLTVAASAPVPLPSRQDATSTVSAPAIESPRPKKVGKAKTAADTVAITLRPEKDLLNRYTIAAADRTCKAGKVISAQQIMLEVLDRGLQGKP